MARPGPKPKEGAKQGQSSKPVPADEFQEFTFRTRRMTILAYPQWDRAYVISPPNDALTLTIEELWQACKLAREAKGEADS